jgi:hypothetical protein
LITYKRVRTAKDVIMKHSNFVRSKTDRILNQA